MTCESVPRYRGYFLDASRAIRDVSFIECANDDAAKEWAREPFEQRKFPAAELWLLDQWLEAPKQKDEADAKEDAAENRPKFPDRHESFRSAQAAQLLSLRRRRSSKSATARRKAANRTRRMPIGPLRPYRITFSPLALFVLRFGGEQTGDRCSGVGGVRTRAVPHGGWRAKMRRSPAIAPEAREALGIRPRHQRPAST